MTDADQLLRGRHRAIAAGAGAAVVAVGIGLGALAAVTVPLWLAVPHPADAVSTPLRVAGLAWLSGQRIGITGPYGEIGLTPLAVMALLLWLAYRAGGWAVRWAGDVDGLPGTAAAVVGLAVTYPVLAGVIVRLVTSDKYQPHLWQALASAVLISAVAGGLGAVRAAGLLPGWLAALPAWLRVTVRGAQVGVLAVLGGGALVAAAALGWNLARGGVLYDAVASDWAGGIGLTVVSLAYLPNAIVWATSFALGPGFALGTGTSVSLTGVELEAVPALPLLAALPASFAPDVANVALVVPVVAGLLVGWLVARRAVGETPERAALIALGSGVLTGVVLLPVAALSGGPFGGGRLVTLGPSAWQVGVATALEISVTAPVIAWLARWWRTREAEPLVGPLAEPDPEPPLK